MSIVSVFDMVALAVILLCAGDALRQVSPKNQPVRALAFGLVTIGAFGWIAYDIHDLPIQWWAVSLHTGFAIYAVLLFQGRNRMWRKRHVDPPRRSVRRTA